MIELDIGIIPKENIHSVTISRKYYKGRCVYLLLVTYCKGKVFHTIKMGSEYGSEVTKGFDKIKEILKSQIHK